jgi:hypothetical protein
LVSQQIEILQCLIAQIQIRPRYKLRRATPSAIITAAAAAMLGTASGASYTVGEPGGSWDLHPNLTRLGVHHRLPPGRPARVQVRRVGARRRGGVATLSTSEDHYMFIANTISL